MDYILERFRDKLAKDKGYKDSPAWKPSGSTKV